MTSPRREPEQLHQCKSCPWRTDCEPDKDIPRYERDLHCALSNTIRSGPESLIGPLVIMACHYSKPDEEFPCAGWLANQLGPGNNLLVRMQVATGRLPVPITDGPQHPTFEETLKPTKRAGGRISIRAYRYRGEDGFLVSGTDPQGSRLSIWTYSRESADHIKAKKKAGQKITTEDYF